MFYKSTIFSLFFLFFAAAPGVFAQSTAKGQVAGTILEKSTGDAMIGASVAIEGTAIGTVTDIEGKFVLALEPGAYTVKVSYLFFKTTKIAVQVKAGEVAYVQAAIEEEKGNDIQEVVITATAARSTTTAQLIERRNVAQVSDGISADIIRRTPDRTTSDVLKRVTGTTIQEGKFAIIRGMNDRYNVGFLDGALLPSTEADRKAFAFDALPAGLIDNIAILKTGTPDLVGDFGGGVIRIQTKSVPEQFSQTISIGGQTHSLTTFRNFTQFKQYPGEAFNIFGDQRAIPSMEAGSLRSASTYPSSEEKRAFGDLSTGFNNDWSYKTASAAPNSRLAYSLGFPIKLDQVRKIGVVFAVNYADTRRYSERQVNTFDGGGQVSKLDDRNYLRTISNGAILNVNYVGAKSQWSLRNLLHANSDRTAVLRTGIANITDAVNLESWVNLIQYNRLYNSILSVKQVVGDNLFVLNAAVNVSDVHRKVPDYRIVNYTQTPDDEAPRMAMGDFFNSATGRFSSDLQERLVGGNLDVSKQLNVGQVKTEVKAGLFFQKRHRSFWGRSFVYGGNAGEINYDPAHDLSAEQIGAGKLYLVEKNSDDIAYYDGNSTLQAAYLMADQKIYSKLRAVYGARYEQVDIALENKKVGADIAGIKKNVFLPSMNLSYAFSEKINLRAAYSATVNRPEFRELAPFAFYVFDKNAEIKGNKDLQIAHLNNYDLRFELFPSGNQLVSVGGFYKTIANPIEFSIDITQPFTTFTYTNEKSAKIYGVELELRKNLDFIGKRAIWSSLSFTSNLALIKSELAFDEGSMAAQNRPLQGQSPYVLNAGIQYDSQENGWFASAVVNRIGRRIAFVGVDPTFGDTRQDIYEAPRTVVDFQIGRNIKQFSIKLTVGDILHQDQIFYQDADHNGKFTADGTSDRLMFGNTNGQTLALNIGYNF